MTNKYQYGWNGFQHFFYGGGWILILLFIGVISAMILGTLIRTHEYNESQTKKPELESSHE